MGDPETKTVLTKVRMAIEAWLTADK